MPPKLSPNQERTFFKMLGSYTQRWLEPAYDKFFDYKAGRWLISRTELEKRIIEFMMYSATTLVDLRLNSDKLYLEYLKDIISDMAPEIAHRMINGRPEFYPSEVPHDNEAFKRALVVYAKSTTAEQKRYRDGVVRSMTWLDFVKDINKCLREIIQRLDQHHENRRRSAW